MEWGECVCQLTTSLSIDNEIRVVNWQGVYQLTYKNPCQLRKEMGWMRYQSTIRSMRPVFSIDDSLVNWQCSLTWNQHLHPLSIENTNHDGRVVNGMACNRSESTTNKIRTGLSIDILLNWKQEYMEKRQSTMMLSIDNSPTRIYWA